MGHLFRALHKGCIVVNLKWRDAVADSGFPFTEAEQKAGWPQAMTADKLAALQRPVPHGTAPEYKARLKAYRALEAAIVQACVEGAVKCSTETRETVKTTTRTMYSLTRNAPVQVPVREAETTEVKLIAAADFAAWLSTQSEEPSSHITAWLEALGTQTKTGPLATVATVATLPPLSTLGNDLLAPLVNKAIAECGEDKAAVFTLLKTWAKEKRAPMFGITEDGKIQWTDSNDKVQELSRRALGLRMTRAAAPRDKPPKPPLRRVK